MGSAVVWAWRISRLGSAAVRAWQPGGLGSAVVWAWRTSRLGSTVVRAWRPGGLGSAVVWAWRACGLGSAATGSRARLGWHDGASGAAAHR
ncbi:hypothetical protein HNR22_003210 [Micromonospora jinlongensis]|uniref:Uncharacterized protein n=1 Tax=Micromonospora jinlongensis TaxID=1287877 RepID=A0A7Z0BDM8_9ACTN|nr:hypothetical protein [Micromonospora jinlongensis]